MSEQTPFKKRLTTILKPDRRLSPLNPQAAIVTAKIQESPPQSPLAVLLSSDSDSYSLPQAAAVRKKSVGLNLRKLAANEKPISALTATKPVLQPKATILQNTTILDNPTYRHRFLNEPRSHWLFRSTSLTELPKWSGLYEETIFKKDTGMEKGNALLLRSDESKDSPRSTESSRKRTLSHQPFEAKVIDTTQVNPKALDAIPSVARLEKFAASLTAWDIELYTSIVETSRRAKNYLWKSDPVAIWPDWHEGLGGPSNSASPMPSYLEIKYDPPTPTGGGIHRPPSRGRSNNSPVLTPLPMNRDRSMSPGFSLDPDKYSDSDSYSERGDPSRPSRRPGSKLRKNLSISTKYGSPGKSPETASSEFKHTRSHSDGDLTEYLKGFSNLKTSLQIAQVTCNNEIKKILDELQYHVEKGIEVLRKEGNRPSTTTVDLGRSSLTTSKSSLIAVYQKDSARNSMVRYPGDVDSSVSSSSNNLTNSESSKLDTIMSANSADQTKLETILSAGLGEQELPFNIADTTPKPLEKKYHKKTKSDSIKLAIDLKLDSSQSSQEDMPTESPFMKAISSVISVAHNILSLDITSLLQPQIPQKYIAQIQKLQQLWTENPEWQLQELVVRLLIVFAGVVRLVDHFDEDFRSWNSLTNTMASPGKNFFVDSNRGRRSSHFSTKSSPHDSPSGFSFKRGSYSSAGAGADSSDYDEVTYDSEASRESPSRRNPAYALFPKGFKPAVKNIRSFGSLTKSENASLSAFRAAVDEEQSLNVLLEHDAEGLVTYISPGVKKIFLYSPDVILNTKSIPFLHDSPTNFFLDATMNSTKHKPNLQLCIDAKRADGRSVKIECNGLVTYSESDPDQIKNVVWIIRPVKVVGNIDFPTLLPLSNDENREEFIPNVDLALCNICERSVPAIHFAVHSDICVKVHKTEMELVLMNDELRNLKQSAEDRLGLINEEIAAITAELNSCDEIKTETKVKYLSHLKTLRELTNSILTAVEDALSLKIPKDDCTNDTPTNTSQFAVWNCPNERSFLPEFINDLATENSLLSDDLSTIGKGCYVLGKAVQNCSEQKLKMVAQMKTEFGTYSECLQTEHHLLMEIEVQTSKNANFESDVNEESKFEIKEVGGIMVKIPSVLNLKDGYGSSPKESILFTNSGDSIAQSNSPPTEYEEAGAPKILKRPSKQNSLRIQTYHDSNSDGTRRTSLRNPRMVVGDKSLEIESLLSPITTSSSGNLRRNSLLPASASSFSSPLIGTPIANLPSIKDYELVKAISKGAFGSVFLAKKKITGLYYAIKVLRKADMVAKNQVSNIKSERTILTQLDSPYVVKLYSTFQSRNHIYLVMEYLNGGDCAALLKAMGQFDEPWSKQYITEMIQGLDFLHQRDIVHRDLKPDNILIDTSGHIKLTDFGLSKAGFIGRRAIGVGDVPVKTPDSLHSMSSARGLMNRRDSIASVSSNDSSAGLGSRLADRLEDKGNKKLVGTPDYLAPESILGLGQGTSVDWWAVGVILYEFLHGFPPFNAATPQLVFENILMRKIEWDDEVSITPQARQLMDRLMCADVEKRLGTRGAAEVKAMEWFAGTDWDNLMEQKVFFVPTVKNIEDTDYFDTRGAHKPAKLSDSDEEKSENGSKDKLPSATATEDSAADFGEAVYKNLPLLEKANLKMMNKINQDFPEGEQWLQKRRDSLPINNLGSPTLSFGSPGSIQPPRSISPRHFSSINSSRRDSMPVNPQSSLIAPVPISSKKKVHQQSGSFENLSRTSSSSLEPRMSPSPLSDLPRISYQGHSQNALKGYESDGSLGRASSPDQAFKKRSQAYLDSAKQTLFETRGRDEFSDDAGNSNSEVAPLDVLIAESNPVAAQILETILRSLNCRCVRVKTGGDVVQCALGEIKFDIIFVDVNLPVLTGDAASRMIKATANTNMNTPVIALATNLENTTFSDFNHVLLKPVTRVNVEGALQALNLL